MGPDLIQHPLTRADGSAVFSDNLYTVVAGVNGPVEVSRRDEAPEEAVIDVHIRPSSGIGGPRERWLETVIQSTLKSVILVKVHPRTLIQITMQITKQPSLKLKRAIADTSIIPSLFNAAFIALLDSGLPLSGTASAVLAVVRETGEILYDPSEKELVRCGSIHAMAYEQSGAQILVESAGSFDFQTWEKVAEGAGGLCKAAIAGDNTASNPWLRQALQDRAETANAWRDET